MKRREKRFAKPARSAGLSIWSVVGGAALALVATAVIANLHDIRRYVRIMRM